MAEETSKKTRRTERIGKYEILDLIATGGMGIIYKARDVDLDRLVALKILPAEMAKQKKILIRFQREAKAAALLRHENIVTIYDVGESNGTYFLALEFVEGSDLQDYINRKCRLDPDEARQIILQAAHALAHAHEMGIVHRDIKPSNLLLTRKGKRLIVKLTDFGLAIRHENEEDFRITRAKTTVGTVDYMSPEQARDSRSVDIRSDIYSLGCTFFHMLAGKAPFARGTLPERILKHMEAPPPDVSQLNESVPKRLVAIIDRMLEKDPKDRYQTPADLVRDLEALEEEEAGATDAAEGGKLQPGARRKKAIDPTMVIEKEEAEEERPDAWLTRPAKSKKPVAEPVEEVESEAEPEAAKETVHEPSESDSLEETIETAPPREKPKRKSAGSLVWMYATGGTVGVLLLVLMLALLFGGKGPAPPAKKDPEPKKPAAPPQPVVVVPEVKIEKPPPPPAIDTSAHKMTVAALDLPVMDTRPQQLDLTALQREYRGAFTTFPEAPKDATVLRVSRFAAPAANAFATLADAFAATQANRFTIVEIDDNGPIYVPFLAPLSRRNVLVRGGAGYRPLLVWDVPKKGGAEKPPAAFCAFAQGKLMLDNLDFAMRWSDDAPAVVFDLPDSDFHARDCTFSLAGKSAAGIALVRRHTAKTTPIERIATRTWLRRCYLRGADAVVLDLRETPAEVLIEDSLLVGYQRPLFQLYGRDDDAFSFYCVRSTLVAGQTLLRWQSARKSGGGAPLHCRALDSILSRDDTLAASGDMLHLPDVVDLARMNWRAENTVYAGWKRLLASDLKNIAGTDKDAWHRQWLYSTGDRLLVDTWPLNPPTGLEDQPAGTFLPARAPVAFAALTRGGAIGCVIGRLPPAPQQWLERTLEPRTVPIIASIDPEAPAIAAFNDGFYHGERLDLAKVDLGAHLAMMLRKYRPAERVVLHLRGQGTCPTSPIRVQGVRHLILYFEPAKNPKDALTLEAGAKAILDRAPIVEMTGGHLEIIGARVRLSSVTLVPTIVQVQDGHLTLTRCWLQGPLTRSADGFQSLIAIANANASPTTLLLRENTLAASKLLIAAHGNVEVNARNNVFFSLGDAVRFQGDGAALLHLFDHNTLAVWQTFFDVRPGPATDRGGTVRLHAAGNAFLCPFREERDKTVLVRGMEARAAQGRWTWHGRSNVYDARLRAFFAHADQDSPPAQSLGDWQKAWGQPGEQHALLLSAAQASKIVVSENVTTAILPSRLERLVLPKQLRVEPGEGPPGADPAILKKKG